MVMGKFVVDSIMNRNGFRMSGWVELGGWWVDLVTLGG